MAFSIGELHILTLVANQITPYTDRFEFMDVLHSVRGRDRYISYGGGSDKGSLVHYAAFVGNQEAVKILISRFGLNSNKLTQNGLSLAQIWESKDHPSLKKMKTAL